MPCVLPAPRVPVPVPGASRRRSDARAAARRRPRGRELRLASALSVHTACGLFAIKSGNINDVQVGSALTRDKPIHPRPRSVTRLHRADTAIPPGAAADPGRPENRDERDASRRRTTCRLRAVTCVSRHTGGPLGRPCGGARRARRRPRPDHLRTLGLHIGNALTTDIGTALTTDIPRSTAPPRPRRAPSTPQSEVI